MKVAIVGSRSLELDGEVATHVLNELVSLGERGFEEVLLRKPLRRSSRPFEALVASLAGVLGFRIVDWVPEPGGRAQVFFRDIEMVKDADEVVAFFPEGYFEGEHVMSGTAHVVEQAQYQERPVRAYVLMDGKRVLVGSDNDEGRT